MADALHRQDNLGDGAVEALDPSVAAVIDHLPYPATLRRADNRIVHANAPALAMFGVPLAEVIGRDGDGVGNGDFDATLTARHRALLRQLVATGEAVSDELRLAHPDGARRFRLTLFPVALGDGALVASMLIDESREQSMVVAADNGAARRAQANELLGAFIHASPVLMALRDPQGCYLEVSSEVCRRFNLPRSHFIGRTDRHLAQDPTGAAAREQIVRDVVARGELRVDELRFPLVPGLVLESCTFPLRDNSGVLIAVGEVAMDVSHHRRTQALLEEQARQLEEFTYASAHDLKEPLRTVAGFISLLVEDLEADGTAVRMDGDDQLRLLRQAAGSTARMANLVDGLLDLGTVNRSAFMAGPVDVGAVVEEVLVDLQGIREQAGARITTGALGSVPGDAVRLRQLFQNLLANAIRFRHAERVPDISISRREEDGMAVFSVQDNGIGIPADKAELVFKVFERLHPRSRYPGHGMGLAVCRTIVARHGGSIAACPAAEGGTSMVVRLPLRPPREDADVWARRPPGSWNTS